MSFRLVWKSRADIPADVPSQLAGATLHCFLTDQDTQALEPDETASAGTLVQPATLLSLPVNLLAEWYTTLALPPRPSATLPHEPDVEPANSTLFYHVASPSCRVEGVSTSKASRIVSRLLTAVRPGYYVLATCQFGRHLSRGNLPDQPLHQSNMNNTDSTTHHRHQHTQRSTPSCPSPGPVSSTINCHKSGHLFERMNPPMTRHDRRYSPHSMRTVAVRCPQCKFCPMAGFSITAKRRLGHASVTLSLTTLTYQTYQRCSR